LKDCKYLSALRIGTINVYSETFLILHEVDVVANIFSKYRMFRLRMGVSNDSSFSVRRRSVQGTLKMVE